MTTLMNFDLNRMRRFDAALGYPSQSFAAVHVAGTNGKGSVCTKIAKGLEYGGKKVGLFTSPHLFSFCERVQFQGVPIEEAKAEALLTEIRHRIGEEPTYFEAMTLLAFVYFSREKVDWAVIEVGMGGRLDATNVLHPRLCVITSIGFDHTQFLGETLLEIAREKAGIIKSDTPLVLGPRARPLEAFQSDRIHRVEGQFSHYEEENQAVARRALELLGFYPHPLALEFLPPARMQMFHREGVEICVDVAHNPSAFERLFERLKRPVRVVVAFSEGKLIHDSLEVIARFASGTHLCYAQHERAHTPLGAPPMEVALFEGFHLAKERGECLLICGTFFMMEEAFAWLAKLERGNVSLTASGGDSHPSRSL